MWDQIKAGVFTFTNNFQFASSQWFLSVLCVCVYACTSLCLSFLCVQPHILALQSVLAELHYPVGWAGTFCQGESLSSHTHPDHNLGTRVIQWNLSNVDTIGTITDCVSGI